MTVNAMVDETSGLPGVLHSPPASPAAGIARGLAWIWGLGPLSESPDPATIGFGGAAELAELSRLVAERRLGGAIVLTAEAGPQAGLLPARRSVEGVAEFGGTRVQGELAVFDSEDVAVRSSMGVHGVERDDILILGIDPERHWGRLDAFWAYEAIAAFIEERIDRPLAKLPPIACLRLDDMPGTGAHQMLGRDSTDRRQSRRIPRLAGRLRSAGAVISMAVVAQALEGERRVPLEQVWPESVRALRDGIDAGAFEPVCHGLLHLDPDALGRREVEVREFLNLDAEQAGEHLDRAIEWMTRHLGAPTTFCAPAWAYGPAADEEAAARGLIRWDRPRPGPLLEDGRLYESLIGELQGLYRLDYSPLVRMAAIGIPPVFAMHGALLDGRLENLGGRLRGTGSRRQLLTLARLFVRRDMIRLIGLEGLRWVGTDELVEVLTAHGRADGRRPA
jgi:hypothetical protein